MPAYLRAAASIVGSAIWWFIDKMWGDRLFAWLKQQLPPWTIWEMQIVDLMRLVWDYGVPVGLIILAAYFAYLGLRKPKKLEGPPVAADLVQDTEHTVRRIDALGAKYPLMMPDDPEYPSKGKARNEVANEAYMRGYREGIATDVQRIFTEAIGRGLMDDPDQIYSRETVVARRGVEEIGRILIRIARNVRAGSRAPLPANVAPKPDYPNTPLVQFVDERVQLGHPADNDAVDDYLVVVGSLFEQIRDKAVLGQITVWGRENCPVGQRHTPLTPIPADHWKIAQIDLVDYLSDPERNVGCTTPNRSTFNRTYFSDLFLNARQIREAWPARENGK